MEDLDADPSSPTTFPQWALLEYRQMLKLIGPGSTVHFTGLVSTASKEALRQALTPSVSSSSAAFQVHSEGILAMAEKGGIPVSDICLLDPKSPHALSIHDAGIHAAPNPSSTTNGAPFLHFLLGGILGDDPPRDRTGQLRAMGFPTRHLGSVQMTTDTALGVTKRVVEDGFGLNLPGAEREGPQGAMEWIDHPELKFAPGESVSVVREGGQAFAHASLPSASRSACPFGTWLRQRQRE